MRVIAKSGENTGHNFVKPRHLAPATDTDTHGRAFGRSRRWLEALLRSDVSHAGFSIRAGSLPIYTPVLRLAGTTNHKPPNTTRTQWLCDCHSAQKATRGRFGPRVRSFISAIRGLRRLAPSSGNHSRGSLSRTLSGQGRRQHHSKACRAWTGFGPTSELEGKSKSLCSVKLGQSRCGWEKKVPN